MNINFAQLSKVPNKYRRAATVFCYWGLEIEAKENRAEFGETRGAWGPSAVDLGTPSIQPRPNATATFVLNTFNVADAIPLSLVPVVGSGPVMSY